MTFLGSFFARAEEVAPPINFPAKSEETGGCPARLVRFRRELLLDRRSDFLVTKIDLLRVATDLPPVEDAFASASIGVVKSNAADFRERNAASRDLHRVPEGPYRTRRGSPPTTHDLLHAIAIAPGSGVRSRPFGWSACS